MLLSQFFLLVTSASPCIKRTMKQLAISLLCLSIFAVIYGYESNNIINMLDDDNEDVDENDETSGQELEKRSDQTMINIGYLFRGYNILEGNPMPLTRGGNGRAGDPGFQTKIFKATYKGDMRTADQRYKIPDNVEVDGKTACTTSFTSETVNSESEFQRSLLAKVSVSGSGNIKMVKAAFSASAEFNQVSKTLKTNTKTVVKSEATCYVYEARLQTDTPPAFTRNFLSAVKRLEQSKEYGRFLDTYGTHFVESVDMGARYARLEEISKKKQEKLRKFGIDIKRAAEVSAVGIGSAKTDNQFKVSRDEAEKYSKSATEIGEVTIGSKPPADGKISTWIQDTVQNPYPAFYQLKSILELFRPEFFNNIDVNYETIRNELSEYLKGYCNRLKSNRYPKVECEGPPKTCKGGSYCSANAVCNDEPNSGDELAQYSCKCKPGYSGDGRICERVPKWTQSVTVQQKENKGSYGNWGDMENCKNGVFASGFIFRAEKSQGGGDDTGGNAVCLKCEEIDVCSKIGRWGDWSTKFSCPRGSYLSGWRQNTEDGMGWGALADDTSLDNVEYKCRDVETWEETDTLKGQGKEWGRWSRYQECPRGEFICGIMTKVEEPGGDDTALNDIKHQCCKPDLKKKAKKKNLMMRKRAKMEK